MAVEDPKKEDAEVDSDDSDDDMPVSFPLLDTQITHASQALEDSTAAGGIKQNRAEKKARKAVQKLGMKQVTGIVRVTVKKAKNVKSILCRCRI